MMMMLMWIWILCTVLIDGGVSTPTIDTGKKSGATVDDRHHHLMGTNRRLSSVDLQKIISFSLIRILKVIAFGRVRSAALISLIHLMMV